MVSKGEGARVSLIGNGRPDVTADPAVIVKARDGGPLPLHPSALAEAEPLPRAASDTEVIGSYPSVPSCSPFLPAGPRKRARSLGMIEEPVQPTK